VQSLHHKCGNHDFTQQFKCHYFTWELKSSLLFRENSKSSIISSIHPRTFPRKARHTKESWINVMNVYFFLFWLCCQRKREQKREKEEKVFLCCLSSSAQLHYVAQSSYAPRKWLFLLILRLFLFYCVR
jgi:hypothetical protein